MQGFRFPLTLTFSLFTALGFAQAPAAPQANGPSELQRRMGSFNDPGNGAWTSKQIAVMNRIRDGALSDGFALTELRHLSNNIGPRLSGSSQAAHAVEYVAGEMRALGATVTLEKTMVHHWVRGVETGTLVDWVGMTPNTTQKIVLTALGGSVATSTAGIKLGGFRGGHCGRWSRFSLTRSPMLRLPPLVPSLRPRTVGVRGWQSIDQYA
jgi:carboxypeptidase Q